MVVFDDGSVGSAVLGIFVGLLVFGVVVVLLAMVVMVLWWG